MRWISDGDKQRIEHAIELLHSGYRLKAIRELQDVLSNMKSLEAEKPNPEPKIVPLSEAEQHIFYPERHNQ